MIALRISHRSKALLAALAEHLSERDGVRHVSQTEALERAIHHFAQEQGLAKS